MSQRHCIRVLHLYDKYLNIYADRGNMMVLRRRCELRDLAFDLRGLDLDQTFDPKEIDLLYVGGGQDRDQRLIAKRMSSPPVADAIRTAVENDVAVLAVCGGYQLLGREYRDTTGEAQPGVGILPLRTDAGVERLIGNVAIDAHLPKLSAHPSLDELVVGFENHAGRTVLDPDATPFGTVIDGCGNDGRSGTEGCVYRRAVGTYLHGPLLPRNPALADWLIAAALEHRYGSQAPQLADINNDFVGDAQRVALARAAAEPSAPFKSGKLIKRHVRP